MKVTLLIDGVTIIDAQEFTPGSSVVPGFPPPVPGVPNGIVTPPVTTPPDSRPPSGYSLPPDNEITKYRQTPTTFQFFADHRARVSWVKIPPIHPGPVGAVIDGNPDPQTQGYVTVDAGPHSVSFTVPGHRLAIQIS